MNQVRESVRELLTGKIPPDKVDGLARLLSEGTWTHDHPIIYETAKGFGLPVRDDIPAEFLDLMSLYPQPVSPSGASRPSSTSRNGGADEKVWGDREAEIPTIRAGRPERGRLVPLPAASAHRP